MRLVIKDLLPSTTYQVQVRSKNGADVSAWSQTFSIAVGSPASVPLAPTGVTLTPVGDAFHARWNSVTMSTDGSAATDLAGYVVRFRNVNSGQIATFETTDTSFELTFNLNFAMFTPLAGQVGVQIAAKNTVGNQSAWSTEVVAANPAPGPVQELFAEGILDGIAVRWKPPAVIEEDFKEYRAYVGTSSDFAPTDTSLFWRGVGTSATYYTTSTVGQFVKVFTVDKFDTMSTASTYGPVVARSSTEVDVTPPAVPTNLAGTIVDNKVTVTWTAPANPDNDLAGYQIGYRPVGSTDWSYATASHEDASLVIQPIERYKNYELRIRAYDFTFNYSNWSSIVTVNGAVNVAPAVPANLEIAGGMRAATISWDAVADLDLDHYEVQFANAALTSDTVGTIYNMNATVYSLNGLTPGTYYTRVRSVDDAGLKSAWSATVSAAVGEFEVAPTDGTAPASSPTPTVSAGVGVIFVQWTAITNTDPVTYEVHVGTTSGFTTSASTKVGETPSTFTSVQKLANGTALATATNYYVKLIAKDGDGAAPASTPSAAVQVAYVPTMGDLDYQYDLVLSRGSDLVTNGTGYMQSNYNFNGFTFNASDAPTGAVGSFYGVEGSYTQPRTDEFIPVDTNKTYVLSASARQVGAVDSPSGKGLAYMFQIPYDSASQEILPRHYLFKAGTTTTLAADLKPGDTTMSLTNSSGWYGSTALPQAAIHYRSAIFWNYVDSFGKAWPTETYSRNTTGSDFYLDGALDSTTHVATLRVPWAGSLIPAGTAVSNGNMAGSYAYLTWTGQQPTRTWTSKKSLISGVPLASNGNSLNAGTDPTTGLSKYYFPWGTASIKIGFLSNYNASAGSNNAFALVSLSDAAAAQVAANAAVTQSVVEYAVNSSETVAPTTGWSTAQPTRTAGQFTWYRTKITYGTGTTTTSSAALLTGNTGATGAAGTPAKYVNLTATTQVLTSPAGGGATSPTTSVVTGTATNTTISVYEYAVDGGSFSTTVPTGVSRSGNVVTITGGTMTAKTITVRMADSTGTDDTLTVAKVSDGATGSTGAAGADAYTVLLTNESHTFPGSTTAALADSTTSTVIAYKGSTQTTATIGTITGQVTGLTTAVTNNGTNAPVITITVTTSLTATDGTLTVPITVDGKSFTKTISWTVARQGATGSQGIPGPAGADGVTTYTWLKYADTPTTGMSDDPTGKDYIGFAYNKTTSTESVNYADYSWSLIKGDQGVQGIPGTPGADGTTTYTWVKYADDANGAGMSDSPTGKTYIGLAFNKTTATESTTTTDYTWSLIQGPQGTPAATVSLTSTAQVLSVPAAGGATTPATTTVTGTATNTTITAWTYSVDGGAFSATVPAGVSRTTNTVTITGSTMTARTIAVKAADANGVADTLTVAKISDGATGGTGAAGADAYTVLLTNEAHVFPAGTTNALAGSTTSTVIAYKGSTQMAATVGTITGQVTGLTTAITSNGTTDPVITITVTTSLATRNGVLTVPITVDGKVFTKTIAWSLGLQGTTGATGSQGIPGTPGADGITYYTWLKYASSATPAAGDMSDDPTGKTYMGIAVGKTSATESTVYTDYNWSLIQGPQGTQGIPGTPGADGVTTYTWVKYADDDAGLNMTDTPTGKKYIGLAFNKTTATESSTATDYQWSLIQGAAGADAYTVLLTNEAHNFAGGTSAALAGSATSNVLAYKGTVQQTATVGTITGQVTGLTTAVTNNGTTSPLITVTVTTSLTQQNGVLTIPVTVDGVSFTKNMAWSVNRTGATGAAGPSVSLAATTQVFTVDAAGAINPATSVVTGTVSGTTISTWNYSVNGGSFTTTKPAYVSTPSGNSVTVTASTMTDRTVAIKAIGAITTATDTVTIAKVVDGATGSQGIPGTPGADGVTYYTWLKYASSATPAAADMSDDPTGKTYMGIATNKTSATESTVYTDYTWSLIQGPQGNQGIPGTPGADGTTTYTWVKYADNASGLNMTDTPTGKTYIGFAFNKTTATESNTATDYQWSLIQGPQGSAGAPGATVVLTATSQVLTQPSTGGATTPATTTVTGTAINTTITVWEYSVDGAAFSTTVPAGVSRTNNVVTITGSTMTARTITVRMADAAGVADSITVARVSDGATGGTGSAGADAYTVILSNEAQTFAGSTTAALAGSATSQVIAYKGTTQIAATIGTITGQVTGLTTTITNNGTTTAGFTVNVTTSLTATSGVLTVPVTVDGKAFTKTFSWSVSREGAAGSAGAPAATIDLTTTTQALTSPAAGGATNPATATVTGTATNTTISVYEYSVDGAAFSATVPAGVSRTGNVVTITGSTMTARTITVRMASASGVADTLTVAKVVDGATGGTGSAGADAYTVLLTNEAHAFPGSTTAALAGSTTSQAIVYKGAAQIAATIGTITGQVTGLTTAITNNGTTTAGFTVTVTTALTATSGTLTVPITADGKSFTKTFSWSVTREGAGGATGQTGVGISSVTPYFLQQAEASAAPAVPTASPPPAPWTTTEPAYSAGTSIYRTERIIYTNSTFAYTSVSKVSAYEAAKVAQATADSKNKVNYSLSAPGTTANTAGDIWFQIDATEKIIGQWEGRGGTTWVAKTMDNAVIATLDAAKITSGYMDVGRLQTGSITAATGIIGDAAITTAKIADAAITTVKIGDAQITTAKIADAQITTAKIGDAQITNAKIANLAVDNAKIADATIQSAKIANLEANKITAGTGLVNSLTVKSTLTMGDASTNGIIQSYDFSGTTAGYKLEKNNLTINAGSIEARALKIQFGQNLIPAAYADFELLDAFYTTGLTLTNSTTTIVQTGRFNKQALQHRAPAAAVSEIHLGSSTTDYNIPIDASKTYIVSAYVRGGPVASNFQMRLKYSNGTYSSYVGSTTIAASAAWARVSATITAPAGVTAALLCVYSSTATVNAGWDIDGLQVEERIGSASMTTPSIWTPPGTTTIDGAMIRTGEIRSNTNITVNGVSQPMWSINMNGGMQIGSATVRGAITVGATTDAEGSFIQSSNYTAGSSGFFLQGSDGYAEFQNARINMSTSTAKMVVGSTTGASVEVDQNGIAQFGLGADPDDPARSPYVGLRLPYPILRITPGDNVLGVTSGYDPGVIAGMSSDGAVSGITGNFADDIFVGGRSLMGAWANKDTTYDGDKESIMWGTSWGLTDDVVNVRGLFGSTVIPSGTHQFLAWGGWITIPGRAYRVQWLNAPITTSAMTTGAYYTVRLYQETSELNATPAVPSTTSTLMAQKRIWVTANLAFHPGDIANILQANNAGTPKKNRFAVTIQPTNCSVALGDLGGYGTQFFVEDLGPAFTYSGGQAYGSSVPAIKKYTYYFYPNAIVQSQYTTSYVSASWSYNGVNQPNKMIQRTPGSSYPYITYAKFGGSTSVSGSSSTGVTLNNALFSGATKAEIRVRGTSFYTEPSSEAMRVGYSAADSVAPLGVTSSTSIAAGSTATTQIVNSTWHTWLAANATNMRITTGRLEDTTGGSAYYGSDGTNSQKLRLQVDVWK